jgi:hypothetical protein
MDNVGETYSKNMRYHSYSSYKKVIGAELNLKASNIIKETMGLKGSA